MTQQLFCTCPPIADCDCPRHGWRPDTAEPARALPKDYSARKAIPLFDFLCERRLAIREIVKVAVAGNEQHNPGEPLHWAREKSTDQLNTAMRHMLDHGTGNLYDPEPEKAHEAIDAVDLPFFAFLAGYFPLAITRAASFYRFAPKGLDFAFNELMRYDAEKEIVHLELAMIAVLNELEASCERAPCPPGYTMHLAKACWRLMAEYQLAAEKAL